MTEIEHLNQAPITEAVIDIRVKLEDHITLKDLNELAVALKDDFPDCQLQKQVSSEFKIDADGNTENNNTQREIGFRLTSADKRHILQIGLEGFSLSELAPYTEWGDFSSLGKKAWRVYSEGTKVKFIKRIAVRYINNIAIPLKAKQPLEYFFTAAPIIPEGLPQDLSNFQSRITLVDNDNQQSAHIAQAFISSDNSNASILLDIDAFKEIHTNLEIDELWEKLDSVKTFENNIFFKYITDETKEILK